MSLIDVENLINLIILKILAKYFQISIRMKDSLKTVILEPKSECNWLN